jgi:hypothetical protein
LLGAVLPALLEAVARLVERGGAQLVRPYVFQRAARLAQ